MPENAVELRVSQGFDLMFNNEVTTPTGDPENFLKHWYGKITDTSFNYGNYHNEEYDALYEQLIGEFDTEKADRNLYQDAGNPDGGRGDHLQRRL